MEMPESAKKELAVLQDCINHERERYNRAIKPYVERIAFINSCYPQPFVVDLDQLKNFSFKS